MGDAGREARRESGSFPPPPKIWDPDSLAILSGAGGEHLAEEISGIIGLPSTSCLQASDTR